MKTTVGFRFSHTSSKISCIGRCARRHALPLSLCDWGHLCIIFNYCNLSSLDFKGLTTTCEVPRMKIKRIEHIAIAVKSMTSARDLLEKTLGFLHMRSIYRSTVPAWRCFR